MPGAVPGGAGARRIAAAHRGSHPHDQLGGFAANRDRAKEAGRKGGITVKNKYGVSYYRIVGSIGGNTLLAQRGKEFFKEIGSLGGKASRRKRNGR